MIWSALEQIDSVGESHQALKEQYTGAAHAAPRLLAPGAAGPARGGRKPKSEASPAGVTKKQRSKTSGRSPEHVSRPTGDDKAGASKKAKKAPVSGKTKKGEARYKDPNSDKTWSGRGRRPAWFVGEPEKYKIQPAVMQHEAATSSSAVH